MHGPTCIFWANLTPFALKPGAIENEFVTAGYFGGLAGDPDGGKTRVVTQNNSGATYWVGRQVAGGQFTPYWDKVGAVGHYDYGVLTMARTLGSDPNQVAKNGRRVLVGWVQDDPRDPNVAASQSLSRDLSLSADYELLQQFVPEYQALRRPATFEETTVAAVDGGGPVTAHSAGSMQIEIVAMFTFTTTPKAPFGVTALGGAAEIMVDCANRTIVNMGEAPGGCMVNANIQYNGFEAMAGPRPGPVLPVGARAVTMHIIVDHEIVETIVNNRTAMASYHKNIPSAASTAVALVGAGAGSGVAASIKSWHLDAANNAGPQP
jgi:sucrose-6-phosphate hydrolase SacC (GH32 family)